MSGSVEVFRKHAMKIVLVLMVIFFSVMTGGQLFAASGFQALIAQNAYVFVLAAGMLVCMRTGGNIDLSVGSFVCFVGAFGGIMMVRGGISAPLAMVIMLGAGMLYGAAEGFLIAYLKIPSWFATLAGYFIFRSWGAAILDGAPVAPMPEGFVRMFNGGIPYNLIRVAAILLFCHFITEKTAIGHSRKIFFLTYLNMALLSVISAWMTMARLSAVTPTAGTNYELDAILACVVGGASVYGGSGTVFGVVIGAALISAVNLGMSLMGIDPNRQMVIKGAVLLFAVAFETVNHKDKKTA